jgi:prolipoprotein diacylglyceryltransferase
MIANLLNYIVWDPDPILAHLGPMTIRYYSTCWMIGLLLGYLLMSKLYKQQGLSDEKFSPLFLYIFLGVLIGGRLGHCIFYQPEYFLTQWDHFIEMLIPVHHMLIRLRLWLWLRNLQTSILFMNNAGIYKK